MASCISCGAPRSGEAFPQQCEYCGRLHSVSLAYETSLFSAEIKDQLKKSLGDSSADTDADKEYAIVVLYLLEGLDDLAEHHLSLLVQAYPNSPKTLILRALFLLSKRGVRKSKLADVESAVSLLNLSASLGDEHIVPELSELGSIILRGYYQRNSITPNSKLLGLLDRLDPNNPTSETLATRITRFF